MYQKQAYLVSDSQPEGSKMNEKKWDQKSAFFLKVRVLQKTEIVKSSPTNPEY